MDSKKTALHETGAVLLGEVIGTGLMFGIFALVGKFDSTVLWGGIIGALLATVNFFLMALGTGLAADKAQQNDVKGGQMLVQLSYIGRMIGLFLILVLCAKSGRFHVLALVVPLIFVRPALSIGAIFKKKGEQEA